MTTLHHEFLSLCVALAAAGVLSTPGHAQGAERPKYQLLRQNEDWSVLADESLATEPLDAYKYIPVTEDGDWWLSLGASARLRFEDWSGFNFGAPSNVPHHDNFFLTRVRAHADLHYRDDLRFFGELKSAQSTDRDLPGGRRPLDQDTFDIQQLFVDWKVTSDSSSSATIRTGRQMLLLGAQRLVSPLPWGNALRAWDGMTVDLRCDDWHVTGLATAFVPVDKTDFNEGDVDELLYGIYARRAYAPRDGLELYWLGSHKTDATFNGTTGDADRQTLGFRRWTPVCDEGDAEVEFAYQFGEVGAGDVSAWSFASQAGWRPGGGATRYWLGLDWASGDEDPGGDVETFDQLYPLGHAYFGIIDAVGRQNAIDTSLGGQWPVAEDVTIKLGGHSFWLDSKDDGFYNAGGGVSRAPGSFQSSWLGWELDLVATWKPDPHVTAQVGLARFFAGDAIEDSGPSQDAKFLYASVSYVY